MRQPPFRMVGLPGDCSMPRAWAEGEAERDTDSGGASRLDPSLAGTARRPVSLKLQPAYSPTTFNLDPD
ncbi:hypothetical protein SUGI_0182580 [Cryptomeria japonica]|nr:hypothetical protein SUGI_0182580 [Cryptomeria japonica]